MYDAAHRTRCTTGKSTQTGSTATVRFTCAVPDIKAATKSELKRLADIKRNALRARRTSANDSYVDAAKAFMIKGAAAYRETSLTQIVEVEFPLWASPHGKWHSTNRPVHSIFTPIMNALLSF
jgi:hypothetical protein